MEPRGTNIKLTCFLRAIRRAVSYDAPDFSGALKPLQVDAGDPVALHFKADQYQEDAAAAGIAI